MNPIQSEQIVSMESFNFGFEYETLIHIKSHLFRPLFYQFKKTCRNKYFPKWKLYFERC